MSFAVAMLFSCLLTFTVNFFLYFPLHITIRGHAVAHLVEALRYKPEGRGFDSRWCHWNFSWS